MTGRAIWMLFVIVVAYYTFRGNRTAMMLSVAIIAAGGAVSIRDLLFGRRRGGRR